jgi:hypothetical protein
VLDKTADQAKTGYDPDAQPGMTKFCKRAGHQNRHHCNGSEQLRTQRHGV